MKTEQFTVPLGEQEPGWIEPVLDFPRLHVTQGPPALLGMVSKRRSIYGKPRFLVRCRNEWAQCDVRWKRFGSWYIR
jgi:hypothetical protein